MLSSSLDCVLLTQQEFSMSTKKMYLQLLSFLALCLSSYGFTNQDLLPQQNYQIVVNNRILAKVQGQTISVLDVMKKMDVFLNNNYPEVSDNTVAKYQFYASQWKTTLGQMIDNELIITDAEAKKITVSDGDVRETIQEKFGPNVMITLDKLGITYEEARKMVHSDIIVKKMTWFKVNSKALQAVNPKDVKGAFQKHIIENPPVEEWDYKVISIRNKSEDLGAQVAQIAHNLLQNKKAELANLKDTIQTEVNEDVSASLAISEDFHATNKDISEAHKQVLSTMQVNTFSPPTTQRSRVDNSTVHRIFYLKNHSKTEAPTFNEISNKLENDLIHDHIQKESSVYIQKLRKYYGYDEQSLQENIPANFEPFSIR